MATPITSPITQQAVKLQSLVEQLYTQSGVVESASVKKVQDAIEDLLCDSDFWSYWKDLRILKAKAHSITCRFDAVGLLNRTKSVFRHFLVQQPMPSKDVQMAVCNYLFEAQNFKEAQKIIEEQKLDIHQIFNSRDCLPVWRHIYDHHFQFLAKAGYDFKSLNSWEWEGADNVDAIKFLCKEGAPLDWIFEQLVRQPKVSVESIHCVIDNGLEMQMQTDDRGNVCSPLISAFHAWSSETFIKALIFSGSPTNFSNPTPPAFYSASAKYQQAFYRAKEAYRQISQERSQEAIFQALMQADIHSNCRPYPKALLRLFAGYASWTKEQFREQCYERDTVLEKAEEKAKSDETLVRVASVKNFMSRRLLFTNKMDLSKSTASRKIAVFFSGFVELSCRSTKGSSCN